MRYRAWGRFCSGGGRASAAIHRYTRHRHRYHRNAKGNGQRPRQTFQLYRYYCLTRRQRITGLQQHGQRWQRFRYRKRPNKQLRTQNRLRQVRSLCRRGVTRGRRQYDTLQARAARQKRRSPYQNENNKSDRPSTFQRQRRNIRHKSRPHVGQYINFKGTTRCPFNQNKRQQRRVTPRRQRHENISRQRTYQTRHQRPHPSSQTSTYQRCQNYKNGRGPVNWVRPEERYQRRRPHTRGKPRGKLLQLNVN